MLVLGVNMLFTPHMELGSCGSCLTLAGGMSVAAAALHPSAARTVYTGARTATSDKLRPVDSSITTLTELRVTNSRGCRISTPETNKSAVVSRRID